MFGLLNVYKPAGVTSRDVVNQIQVLVRPVKVGHAGTLDPLAEGVLVVCLGPATRLTTYVQQMNKQYRASFLLGRSSPTDDVDGEVTETVGAIPTRQEILGIIPSFCGTIQQTPPIYSAVKLRGRRAHAMARQGESVELASRPVTIHQIELEAYDYPELRLLIECGSGTYVRALGRDLAAALGTTAVMSALTRTAIGRFRIEDSLTTRDLSLQALTQNLIAPIEALDGRPRVALNEMQQQRIVNGNFIESVAHGFLGDVPAVDDQEKLTAVLKPDGPDRLRPEVVFPRQALA